MSSPVSPSKAHQDRLPPSPPKSPGSSLSRIVSHVAALHSGDPSTRTAPLQAFSILESEYAQLDPCLERVGLYDFYHNEVRHDYDPSRGHLIFRMPTRQHDVLAHKFVQLILTKITALARILEQDYPAISRRLLQLQTMTTSDIDLISDDDDLKLGHKSPDASIGYEELGFPQAVFEVSYSQAHKKLAPLAWSYIMGTRHAVRCVVGLDLDYPRKSAPSVPSPARSASVSIWRPLVEIEGNIKNMDVKQETTDQCLGELNPDHSIAVLYIRDLLSNEYLEGTSPDVAEREIVITSREMTDILASAENCQKSTHRNGEKLLQDSQDQNCNWRKRRPTPDEELSDGREAKYRIIESIVEQQRSDDDTSYMPASGSSAGSHSGLPRRSTRSRIDA
ncbi:hypothetical protein KCU85_g9856, partial [Aureobasidium melanogenum]